MTVRVGINGFGRIGRNFVRAVLDQGADVDVVAVNDLTSADDQRPPAPLRLDPGPAARSRSRSSTATSSSADRRIQVLAERDPADLPWGDLGVDVVIESTGRFTARHDAAAHLKGGASRVIISAPSGDADATFVVGVNDGDFDPDIHVVVSNASCTTNCFVPMVKVIDDAFGIVSGPDDDGPRLHQRPEPPRPAPPGPAAGPGRGHQHRAGIDRRGPGDEPGPGVDEGEARRHRAAGAGPGAARSPTSPRSSAARCRWPR